VFNLLVNVLICSSLTYDTLFISLSGYLLNIASVRVADLGNIKKNY
jgi:hypothetical protein